MKLAIFGFRHGHVGSLYATAQKLDWVDLVACVEEDPAAREDIPRQLGITLTHETYDQALQDTDCDAVACVDYYAKRGPTVIKALEAGKHVITDKPLCTRADELAQIARLSREKGLVVMVQLTMRYGAGAQTFGRLVREGAVGDLVSATVLGQHPLSWGSRPGWYFEEGKHGGTINDIMIHGIDMLRWATGKEFTRVISAAASGVQDSPAPDFFQQSAQCFLEMEGGARVFGDSSYLAPTGHASPWRFYLWGSQGHIAFDGTTVRLQRSGEEEAPVEFAGGVESDPLDDFARQVARGESVLLTPEECFRSTAVALAAQAAADTGQRDVDIRGV